MDVSIEQVTQSTAIYLGAPPIAKPSATTANDDAILKLARLLRMIWGWSRSEDAEIFLGWLMCSVKLGIDLACKVSGDAVLRDISLNARNSAFFGRAKATTAGGNNINDLAAH